MAKNFLTEEFNANEIEYINDEKTYISQYSKNQKILKMI